MGQTQEQARGRIGVAKIVVLAQAYSANYAEPALSRILLAILYILKTVNCKLQTVNCINIGLNIDAAERGYKFKDSITDFIIPELSVQETRLSDVLLYKEQCRERLRNIPHEYLSLVDLAFDASQSRMFEMQTIDLLVNECKFSGAPLRLYLPDPKAVSCELFAGSLNPFISSVFKGNVSSALKRIALDTGVSGAAINVVALLLVAEKLKGGSLDYNQFYSMLDANEEVRC